MTRDASAHAENHGAVHAHQALESVLVTPFDELLEQLPIGQGLGIGREIAFGILPSKELHQSLSASSIGRRNSAILEKSLEPIRRPLPVLCPETASQLHHSRKTCRFCREYCSPEYLDLRASL